MTTDEHLDVNIDANEVGGASGPLLERLTCPARFVLATGDSLGTNGPGTDRARSDYRPQLEPQGQRQVASNYTGILRKDFRAVADAVRVLASSGATRSAES